MRMPDNTVMMTAQAFLEGRKLLRPEIVTMIKGLLDLIGQVPEAPKAPEAPQNLALVGPCSTTVEVTPQKAISVGVDANRVYTQQEALAFAGKLCRAVAKARGGQGDL